MLVVHDDTGVAVVEADLVVVARHQQRLTDPVAVPARGGRVLLGEPPGRQGRPVRDAARATAVGTQQPVGVKCRNGSRAVAANRSRVQRRPARDDVGPHPLEVGLGQAGVVLELDQLDVRSTRGQELEHPVGPSGLHVRRQLGDLGHVRAVVGVQGADAIAHRRSGRGRALDDVQTRQHRTQRGRERRRAPAQRRPVDQVAEHGPGLDRSELVRVAHEHQARRGPQRLEQPRHHRQRHHRALVDHHHLVRQPVRRVVPEAAARAGTPAQEPVQRHGSEVAQLLAVDR